MMKKIINESKVTEILLESVTLKSIVGMEHGHARAKYLLVEHNLGTKVFKTMSQIFNTYNLDFPEEIISDSTLREFIKKHMTYSNFYTFESIAEAFRWISSV